MREFPAVPEVAVGLVGLQVRCGLLIGASLLVFFCEGKCLEVLRGTVIVDDIEAIGAPVVAIIGQGAGRIA